MSLQLHRPDGKGGLEVRTEPEQNYRDTPRSPRWGAARKGGRLPALDNPEMNPTSTGKAVVFWVALATITFAIVVAGYAGGLWAFPG
jgi:hypothetical protein